MPPISVCMIAKNEEADLARCLESVKPYGFEVILTDTGSTDRTKEIARRYGAKVFEFPWIGDFSAARNYSAAQAANNWILVIDCDEYITHIDLPPILDLIKKYPRLAGMLEWENEMLGNDNTPGNENIRTFTTKIVRFYHRKYYHYTGTIHEQVVPIGAFEENDLKAFDIPLRLYHTGYVGSPEKIAAKNKRNMDMLLEAIEKNPADAYNYFQVGQTYIGYEDYEAACEWFGKALSFDLEPSLEYVQMMMVSYGQSLLLLNKNEEALSFAGVYDAFCGMTDFVYLMGRIYEANNQPIKALGEFLKAITMPSGMQAGVNSFLPCYQIAVIYDNMNNMDIAVMYYNKCGDFAPAKRRLIELNG